MIDLESAVGATGGAITAIAAGWWFLYRRELEPSSELSLNLIFAGRQAGHLIVEVEAILSNKSSVRQSYRNFELSVRYLTSSDRICDGEETFAHQVVFPHSIDERIGKRKRYFANSVYINPKTTFRHSYITFIPNNASFVRLHCEMLFRTRDDWHRFRSAEHVKNQQRLFAVPREQLL